MQRIAITALALSFAASAFASSDSEPEPSLRPETLVAPADGAVAVPIDAALIIDAFGGKLEAAATFQGDRTTLLEARAVSGMAVVDLPEGVPGSVVTLELWGVDAEGNVDVTGEPVKVISFTYGEQRTDAVLAPEAISVTGDGFLEAQPLPGTTAVVFASDDDSLLGAEFTTGDAVAHALGCGEGPRVYQLRAMDARGRLSEPTSFTAELDQPCTTGCAATPVSLGWSLIALVFVGRRRGARAIRP